MFEHSGFSNVKRSKMNKFGRFGKVSLLAVLVSSSAILPAVAGVVKVGEKAPTVEALDQDGKVWRLSERSGGKVVLLYFYPKDDTPGCTKEACGLRDRIEELSKLGVEVVGVSRDNAESHQKFRAKHHLNFPLLVDTDGKLTEAYGAAMPDRPLSRRISFLIGKDGRIVHITDNRDAQVHLDESRDAIAKLIP
jgi:peroxiredoxin Q/BCP